MTEAQLGLDGIPAPKPRARKIPSAVVRYRRSPSASSPPFGYDDLPGPVGAWIVIEGGKYLDRLVEAGELHGGSPSSIERATRWDLRHPRDRSIVESLRDPSIDPWELGLRVALAATAGPTWIAELASFVDEEESD